MKNQNKNQPPHLVHLTSSLKIGGAETMLVDLVDRLRSHNFEQTVIYIHKGPHVERIRQLGIPLYQVKGLLCCYDPIFFLRLFLLLRNLKPDCLHTLLWAANFAGRLIARILGIPIAAALHNNLDQNGTIRIALDRFTVRRADTFVAVSDEVRRSFLCFVPVRRAPTINVITNGIDGKRCKDQAMQFPKKREEIGLSDEHVIIGSVGRFVPLKNYPVLIDQFGQVIKRHPHARLVLIGAGAQEEYLRQKIKKNGLTEYVKIIINQPAISYYPLFDCFVLPSYKEGVSMALLEAMSFGRACIVGNHTEKHTVIQSGQNGFVVTPEQSFSKKIRMIIEQPELRCHLGAQAKQTVQTQFCADRMAREYANLFRELECALHNRI